MKFYKKDITSKEKKDLFNKKKYVKIDCSFYYKSMLPYIKCECQNIDDILPCRKNEADEIINDIITSSDDKSILVELNFINSYYFLIYQLE
jgi:hypothetical protein